MTDDDRVVRLQRRVDNQAHIIKLLRHENAELVAFARALLAGTLPATMPAVLEDAAPPAIDPSR